MISVALCTYNGKKFLQDQLTSIEEQSLAPGEIVICDDASTDNTLKVLKEFQSIASLPVKIHQNHSNIGTLKNFEKAVSLCQGEFIAFCDQDDVWQPKKLSKLTEALMNNPEAGYVFTDADLVDEDLSPLNIRLWDSIGFNQGIQKQYLSKNQFRILFKKKIVTGATMAIRTDIAKLAIPYPALPYWLHDGWLALVSSAIGFRGIALAEPLVLYRQHRAQQIGAPDRPETEKELSILEKYRVIKRDREINMRNWEKALKHTTQIERNLRQIYDRRNSQELRDSIQYLNDFIIHFSNRKKINVKKNLASFGLIFKETRSGRYAEFSDSWHSIARDLFI